MEERKAIKRDYDDFREDRIKQIALSVLAKNYKSTVKEMISYLRKNGFKINKQNTYVLGDQIEIIRCVEKSYKLHLEEVVYEYISNKYTLKLELHNTGIERYYLFSYQDCINNLSKEKKVAVKELANLDYFIFEFNHYTKFVFMFDDEVTAWRYMPCRGSERTKDILSGEQDD